MQDISTLTALGLRAEEARLYLTLVRLGEAPASVVAREAGMPRTASYPLLTSLVQQGFASLSIRHAMRYYRPEDPRALLHQYERKLKRFEDMIPSLVATGQSSGDPQGLQYLETLPELKRFYDNMLEEERGKSYRIIGDMKGWENLDPSFFNKFRFDRAAAKIKTKLLLTHESHGFGVEERKLLRECRYLPSGYHFKNTIDIYRDKILVVNYELRGLAVLIRIPSMVDIFQALFDILWDTVPIQGRGDDLE